MATPNPIVTDSYPQLSLVAKNDREETQIIRCRRVVTLIGARPGCKIVVHQPGVSSVHAALVHDGSRIHAVDLLSRKGTTLNDLALTCDSVDDGDRIGIHNWEFGVRIEPGAAESGIDAELQLEHLDDQPPPQLLLEHLATETVLKPQRSICLIGRRHGCDISLEDERVSRVHALLFRHQGQPAVFDLLSKNHTYVNDQRVAFAVLQEEDTLQIGDSVFIVRFKENDGGNGRMDADAAGHDTQSDLIDIHATESSQRWRIADKLEKTSRKS